VCEQSSQRMTCPPRAAARQLAIADITFHWPRLTWPALALRQAGPWSRKSSAQPDGGEGLAKCKGYRREAGSEGSIKQTRVSMDKNRIQGASPCQSAAACGTGGIFRKNLCQCVGELTIEGGNLSAAAHGLRYQLGRRCKRLSLLHDVGDKNSSLCLTGLATRMGRLRRYLESIARFDCSGRLALDR
jgi:hypothetical protein